MTAVRTEYVPGNAALKEHAQKLRRQSTAEERHLWYDYLRSYPVQFVRQRIVGSYIVDFFCKQAKLAVELDGSQHYEEQGVEYDARRTAYLLEQGIEVLRFSNLDVHDNFEGVCWSIDLAVKRRMEGE